MATVTFNVSVTPLTGVAVAKMRTRVQNALEHVLNHLTRDAEEWFSSVTVTNTGNDFEAVVEVVRESHTGIAETRGYAAIDHIMGHLQERKWFTSFTHTRGITDQLDGYIYRPAADFQTLFTPRFGYEKEGSDYYAKFDNFGFRQRTIEATLQRVEHDDLITKGLNSVGGSDVLGYADSGYDSQKQRFLMRTQPASAYTEGLDTFIYLYKNSGGTLRYQPLDVFNEPVDSHVSEVWFTITESNGFNYLNITARGSHAIRDPDVVRGLYKAKDTDHLVFYALPQTGHTAQASIVLNEDWTPGKHRVRVFITPQDMAAFTRNTQYSVFIAKDIGGVDWEYQAENIGSPEFTIMRTGGRNFLQVAPLRSADISTFEQLDNGDTIRIQSVSGQTVSTVETYTARGIWNTGNYWVDIGGGNLNQLINGLTSGGTYRIALSHS